MNRKPVQEQTLRVIAIAAAGFAALLLVLPEWATAGVAIFGAIYAALVFAIDRNVRSLFTSTRAKSPGARRAAT